MADLPDGPMPEAKGEEASSLGAVPDTGLSDPECHRSSPVSSASNDDKASEEWKQTVDSSRRFDEGGAESKEPISPEAARGGPHNSPGPEIGGGAAFALSERERRELNEAFLSSWPDAAPYDGTDEFWANIALLEYHEDRVTFQLPGPPTVEIFKGDLDHLVQWPTGFASLPRLNDLALINCMKLDRLPSNFGGLKALTKLSLHGCENLASLPDSFGDLHVLAELDMSYCTSMASLPRNFGNLTALEFLNLEFCSKLVDLPNDFGGLTALTTLKLSNCKNLASLPEGFGDLASLKQLDMMSCDLLRSLPNNFDLLSLKTLTLRNCTALVRLWRDYSFLPALQKLDLAECEALRALPRSSLRFGARMIKLEQLNLRNCIALRSLPPRLGELLPNLSTLILTGCESLHRLPDSISGLSRLTNFSIMGCSNLEELPLLPPKVDLEKLDFEGCDNLDRLIRENASTATDAILVAAALLATLGFSCFTNHTSWDYTNDDSAYFPARRGEVDMFGDMPLTMFMVSAQLSFYFSMATILVCVAFTLLKGNWKLMCAWGGYESIQNAVLATATITLMAAVAAIVCAFIGAGLASIPEEFGHGKVIYLPAGLSTALSIIICVWNFWPSRPRNAVHQSAFVPPGQGVPGGEGKEDEKAEGSAAAYGILTRRRRPRQAKRSTVPSISEHMRLTTRARLEELAPPEEQQQPLPSA